MFSPVVSPLKLFQTLKNKLNTFGLWCSDEATDCWKTVVGDVWHEFSAGVDSGPTDSLTNGIKWKHISDRAVKDNRTRESECVCVCECVCTRSRVFGLWLWPHHTISRIFLLDISKIGPPLFPVHLLHPDVRRVTVTSQWTLETSDTTHHKLIWHYRVKKHK